MISKQDGSGGNFVFQEPLKNNIDYTAKSAALEAILEGTYSDEDINTATQEFIDKLKKNYEVHVTGNITMKEVYDR